MARLFSFRLLVAAVAASLFSFAAPVHGDDGPREAEELKAHDLMMQAHDESDYEARLSDLKDARAHLDAAGPGIPGPIANMRRISSISRFASCNKAIPIIG